MLIMIGLNHKNAPIEIREKFKFENKELSRAMRFLKNKESILESLILSTCNRTELYTIVENNEEGVRSVLNFIAEWFDIKEEEFLPYLRYYSNLEAVQHIFKVSCGLDSLVIGETQILGQMKDSFELAQNSKTTGTVFNELFKRSISFAKNIHTNTNIGKKAVSVSYAAVELAKQIFVSLENKKILVLGTGKMGELTLENLSSSGIVKPIVMNRTYQKAEDLAKKFNGKAEYLDKLEEVLLEVDIVITSASASAFVITKDLMEKVFKKRERAICMIDISLPRNIEPNVIELENVYLYDLDDLQKVVDKNLSQRKLIAYEIEKNLIKKEVENFEDWLSFLEAKPVISSLSKLGDEIYNTTCESMIRKMPNLNEREKEIIFKHTKSAINQLLRRPMRKIRELDIEERSENLNLIANIFDLNVSEKETYYKVIKFTQESNFYEKQITMNSFL